MQLRLLALIAATGGWQGWDDYEDPAELISVPPEPGPAGRAADPDVRAAQVAAFLAAAR